MNHLPLELCKIICGHLKVKYHVQLLKCNHEWYNKVIPFQSNISYELLWLPKLASLFTSLHIKQYTLSFENLRHLHVTQYACELLPLRLEYLQIDQCQAKHIACTPYLTRLTILKLNVKLFEIPTTVQRLKIDKLTNHVIDSQLTRLRILNNESIIPTCHLQVLKTNALYQNEMHFPYLKTLYVSHCNTLQYVLHSITSLTLYFNHLQILPFRLIELTLTCVQNITYIWPTTLRELTLNGFNQNKIQHVLPNLRKLVLRDCYYEYTWPANLQYLTLNHCIIENYDYPKTLIHLELDFIRIPSTLTHLINLEYLQLCSKDACHCLLPTSLIELTIMCKHATFNLHQLTRLKQLDCSAKLDFDILSWPENLTFLHLDCHNLSSLCTWPESLTHLSLLRQTLPLNTQFPRCLKMLKLTSYDQPLTRLPDKLKFLCLGNLTHKYEYAWPTSLVSLMLDRYDHAFEHAWPVSLRMLYLSKHQMIQSDWLRDIKIKRYKCLS